MNEHTDSRGPLLILLCALSLGSAGLEAAETFLPPAVHRPVPLTIHLTPASHLYPGDTLTISASLAETKGSGQEYQFLWDGMVLQDWSPESSCQRALVKEDIGLHRLTVQVRGPDGQGSQDLERYVYRRPLKPSDDEPATRH